MDSHSRETDRPPTTAELAEYGLTASVGLGMLIMALAPLAIPFLALTALFALPLLLPLLVLGLIGAILAGPVLLVRRVVRRRRHQGEATRRPLRAAT